jgi:hypothetical protein
MGILHPAVAHHRVHTVHRVSIAALGLFLLVFGVLGLTRRLAFLATQGAIVMGLSTNGLLATISVLVALVLIAAAVRGGPTASGAGIVFGVLFILSGLANTVVLGSGLNMLAFHLSNVVFSLLIGMALLFVGAYGRISGGLPPDNPYYRAGRGRDAEGEVESAPRTPAEQITDSAADRDLAEAERAVAQGYASPEQAEGVRRAAAFRTPQDRRRAWRAG